MDLLRDLVTHGLADLLLALVTLVLGWVVQGLRGTIQQHAQSATELHKAIVALNVLVAKEYVSKEDHAKANSALWEAHNNLSRRLDSVVMGRGGND